MDYGFISEAIGASRITRHGQITSLSQAFNSPYGMPFSIFILPNVDNDNILTLSVKLYRDDASSIMPFRVKEWSPALISNIDINASILTGNTIYWGS